MPLPQLTPEALPRFSAPPSSRFRELRGKPYLVRLSESQACGSKGLTAAQKAGLRYEAKAQDHLATRLGDSYYVAPYLDFLDDATVPRRLIPDGILLAEGGIVTIFEIKSQHMPEAWWQLRKLYEPVVAQLDGVNHTSCVEVVKSFDPSIGFPEPVTLFSDLDQLLKAPCAGFKVLQWRP